MICFLLCRNGVAVVCSIVVVDEIISDETNHLLFLMKNWTFVNCFLLCRNGVAVLCSVVVADEIISDEINRVLFLIGYWNL